MILVDTSVWVQMLRSRQPLDLLAHANLDEVTTCLPVIQEVLQGISEERFYRKAYQALFSLPVVESPMPASVYVEAAALFRSARRAGITVRSSVDCLIAVCALRHDLEVLHADRDFDRLAKLAPLKQRRV